MESVFLKAFLITFMCGSVVLLLKRAFQMNAQFGYEREFIREHRAIINQFQSDNTNTVSEYIPIMFESRKKEHLLSLCKQSWSMWMTPIEFYQNELDLIPYKARIEIHFLGFKSRSSAFKPIRVEVIRCTDDYAVITASEGASGYLLKNFAPRVNLFFNYKLFYIHTKFNYKLETEQSSDDQSEDDSSASQGSRFGERDDQEVASTADSGFRKQIEAQEVASTSDSGLKKRSKGHYSN